MQDKLDYRKSSQLSETFHNEQRNAGEAGVTMHYGIL